MTSRFLPGTKSTLNCPNSTILAKLSKPLKGERSAGLAELVEEGEPNDVNTYQDGLSPVNPGIDAGGHRVKIDGKVDEAEPSHKNAAGSQHIPAPFQRPAARAGVFGDKEQGLAKSKKGDDFVLISIRRQVEINIKKRRLPSAEME